MEESYYAAAQRDTLQNILSYSFELKYLILGHASSFQGTYRYWVELIVRINTRPCDVCICSRSKRSWDQVPGTAGGSHVHYMLWLCTIVWTTPGWCYESYTVYSFPMVTWRFAFCLLSFTLTDWSFICLRFPVKQYMCFLEVDWRFRIRTRLKKDVSHTHVHLDWLHACHYPLQGIYKMRHKMLQIYNSKSSPNQIFKFIQFVRLKHAQKPFQAHRKRALSRPLCLCCQPSEYLMSLKQTKRKMLKFLVYPWRSVSVHFNVLLYNESFWKDQLSFSATCRMVVAGVLFKRKKVYKVFFIPTWKRIFNVDRFLSLCLCV